jgi:pyruvate dehydrogenase E2 component (dihydrolipoamide acetyltransferase)
MARIFTLPDLGEGLKEAEIVAWHVAVGDHVVADQPLVSVETDKAVVEVPSPFSGTVEALHGRVGETVPVGAPLVAFAGEGRGADAGTVVGGLSATARAVVEETMTAPRGGGPRAAPAVRALATRLGVDLALVPATGPEGTVTRADVEQAARTLEAAVAEEPLKGVRRSMAVRMATAGAEVVPATVSDDADVDLWPAVPDVTMRLVRAIARGCAAEPALNAWFDPRAMTRRLHRRIDLGIAVDTPDGLFVPVLRDVGGRDPADLRRGLDRLRADVARRAIPVEELRGQTITLSNFGMIGGRYAAPVVVPPQVAILSAGRIEARAVVRDGAIVARRMLPLSLTFDHRAVTGGEAARFLAAVVADLAKPE